MPQDKDLIPIREFDGEDTIEMEGGETVRERVVWLVPYRTGRMRRLEKNALVAMEGDTPVVNLGNQEAARAVAAIARWEGPGLDGLPISVESLDGLPMDDFMERVYQEIAERFGEHVERRGPKLLETRSSSTAASSRPAEPSLPPVPGPWSTSSVPPSLAGRLIRWTN